MLLVCFSVTRFGMHGHVQVFLRLLSVTTLNKNDVCRQRRALVASFSYLEDY